MEKRRELIFNCFNCRSLRDTKKRVDIFHWLKTSHCGITLLQETHSIDSDKTTWVREWGGQIYFSHGTSQSRGVAILIPDDIYQNLTIVSETKDTDGRLLHIDFTYEDMTITLINVYAPTKDHQDHQITFLTELNKILEANMSSNMIVAGDFNTQMNVKIDKKGGKIEGQSLYSKYLQNSMKEFKLIDIWRLRNPNDHKFTRREITRGGLVQSRLDYFLIAESITYLIKKCIFKPGNKSDHSLIQMSLEILSTERRGPGTWKFNNKLLLDRSYISLVKNQLEDIKTHVEMNNKNTLWDFIKCQLRSVTIVYSKKIALQRNKRESEIKQLLESLEKEITENSGKLNEYYEVKGIWEKMQSEKAEGAIIRSKVQWTELGEKNTKYFLNLEKRNFNIRYIKKLIKENGLEETNPRYILDEQKRFYQNLYKSRNLDHCTDNFVRNLQIPKLNIKDKSLCDEDLTLAEIAKALKELPNGKTPGSDGFTTDFYKFFWPDIKYMLFDSFMYTFENGHLSNDQRRGMINIIPKEGKDLRYLRNWRPVSLLNTDYKILTKILSNRLHRVLAKLIQPDQGGYIQGRYMGQIVCTIKDIMTYTNIKNIPGYLLLVDFEKAFDSIEWPFMLKCLEWYNFGNNFRKWIQILYTDILSCVSNNGHFSEYFSLSRGIRQGCPISALLFILVAEILAIKIRSDKDIKGITVKNEEYKLCQLADDTTIIVNDIKSICRSVQTINNFHYCSGLKINQDKTIIIPLGLSRKGTPNLPKDLQKLSFKNNAFKSLGIWFSNNEDEMIKLNFENKIKKMESLINIWTARNLSLKGKVTIIKSMVLPQISHLLTLCFCPKQILDRIDKLIFNFLWNKKTT